MARVDLQVSNENKKAVQDVLLYCGQHYGIYKENYSSDNIEFSAVRFTELDQTLKPGLVKIECKDMNAILDIHTGVMTVKDKNEVAGDSSEIKFSLPIKIITKKYPSLDCIYDQTETAPDGTSLSLVQTYSDGNKEYSLRGFSLDKDIDFEGDNKPALLVNGRDNLKNIEREERKENTAIFLKTLPEGSKHTGISTEKKYNSTSYNYESKGTQFSFSSLDGEHFYVWGNFGKEAVYTGESFKLSEIDDFKLDVDALKDKFQPKAPEKEASHAPKDNRPYDLSMANIKNIDADGTVSSRWGRYKGDRHEIFEAAVWAAKEAKVNPNHLVAFIEHESGFNPNTKSPTGAEGLGQFTTGTWNDMVDKYPVRRGGEKFSGLRDAYPELNWGKGTEHRDDVVLNALATAHYMRYNMNQRDSDDRNVGYISHNLGPGGCNQFMRNLAQNPNSECSGDALVKYNPINYTNRGDPLTYRQAYNRIDSHMDNSYGMAVHRGYNPELAKDAVREQDNQVNKQPTNEKDKSTGQIGDDLRQKGVQEYQGNGVLPQEVMDKALLMAQRDSANLSKI